MEQDNNLIKKLLEKITFKRGVFLIVFCLSFSFSLGIIVEDYNHKGFIDIDTVIKILSALVDWLVKLAIFV